MDRLLSEQAVLDKLTKLVNELEGIFSDIRERLVDDSVCGLCEYDCDHGIDGFANECPGFERDDCFELSDKIRNEWLDVKAIPSKTRHWIPITPNNQPKAFKQYWFTTNEGEVIQTHWDGDCRHKIAYMEFNIPEPYKEGEQNG